MDFPGSICASVNDEVIHGIPSNRTVLKDGDIVSVDLVAYKNGFNGDAARTYIVGKPNSVEEHSVYIEVEVELYCRVYENKEGPCHCGCGS